MTSSLKVILWGEEIGRLAWDNRRRLAYFMCKGLENLFVIRRRLFVIAKDWDTELEIFDYLCRKDCLL